MASVLLARGRPLFSLSVGLGLTSLYASQAFYRQKPLRCEAAGATPMTTVSESFKTYSKDAKVPVFRDGRPNPDAYKQISAGSIMGTFRVPPRYSGVKLNWGADIRWLLGLLGGVAVSTFSKTLALLFGMLVFGVQVCPNKAVDCKRRKAD